MTQAELPGRVRRGYGLGSVATGSFGTVPGLLLLPYLTDRLGVAAGVAGLLVLLPKAWDVLLNPIAGRISDRSTHPAGLRRPFLIRAGAALAILFVLLFAGPTGPTWLAAVWVALAFLGCATAYAFFQVPYVSMPAELTTDYVERTRLMTWRVAILALAILVSGGVSPAIRDAVGPEWGYRAVGAFVGGLILVGALGAWWGTKGVQPATHVAAGGTLAEQLRVVAGARDFRSLLTAFALQALATGTMLAGVDYVARTVLGDPGASTILFVAFVAPALLVTPVWERIGARIGKKAGFVAASLLLALGAVLVYALHGLGVVAVGAALTLVGIGYAGAQMFPMAMLPDVAAVDAQRTGESRVGVYTGVWTAGETLGLALGPGVYALVLTLGGYVSSTDGLASQPGSAVTAITLGFTLLPAALAVLALIPLRSYRIDEAAVTAATEEAR
ncbi:MFS transporter [Marihabitans asiaticum]|uniref:Na+/melibiose symporter-like transporter n=1 Tax=Marihabitans asiaticum TaxID=415218 RepID=A0A560WDW6_9MICO|nr:MFS transporter [Marihabitans asiaticum]TWD15822.1 Na+/melibiose symporter-like transporter [Marihabitans asiaticum]